ncbi:MAG: hypothetical protein Ct9H300mP21_06750 [Pseudomonadota bacterium]|nr:MAG: hypothetical protein Ct9H300mP21_06750 [Pseudomonadota bacterium]
MQAVETADSYIDPQKEAGYVRNGLGILMSVHSEKSKSADRMQLIFSIYAPGKYGKFEVGRTRYSIMVGKTESYLKTVQFPS